MSAVTWFRCPVCDETAAYIDAADWSGLFNDGAWVRRWRCGACRSDGQVRTPANRNQPGVMTGLRLYYGKTPSIFDGCASETRWAVVGQKDRLYRDEKEAQTEAGRRGSYVVKVLTLDPPPAPKEYVGYILRDPGGNGVNRPLNERMGECPCVFPERTVKPEEVGRFYKVTIREVPTVDGPPSPPSDG